MFLCLPVVRLEPELQRSPLPPLGPQGGEGTPAAPAPVRGGVARSLPVSDELVQCETCEKRTKLIKNSENVYITPYLPPGDT